MEESKKKSIFPANLLTSSSNLIIFLLLGLILIGLGVLSLKTNIFSSGDKVEVLPALPSDGSQGGNVLEIIVEVGGAIQKPGVYKLPQNSRVDDLLITAGGLSADADREWVDKNINRASKLIDGQKYYVYSQSEIESAKITGGSLDEKVLSASVGTSIEGLININTADQKTLESLNGIGPVYAQNIIEQRPYSNLEELVTKKIIPTKTYEKIKKDITIY